MRGHEAHRGERELCQRLGISRATLREHLQALEVVGLLRRMARDSQLAWKEMDRHFTLTERIARRVAQRKSETAP